MHKLITLIIIALCAINSNAQVSDRNDVVVTQNGNTYKATYNQKSNNGGTASEIWTGKLINGKRDGTWQFTGSYNRFMVSDNLFYTGTAKVIRTYKNGILHGTYIVNYNIQQIGGGYNIFTDRWIYQTPLETKASVNGLFKEGKAEGTWKMSSTQSRETVNISFKDGYVNGSLSLEQQFPKLKTEASFADGYLVYMKTSNPDNWGYQVDYGSKNPKELQPQKTVELSDYLGYWEYYLSGLYLANRYIKEYPENSSDETVIAKYIVSDYDTYCKPWGDVPADVIAIMEHDKKIAEDKVFAEQDAQMKEKLDTIIDNYIETIEPVLRSFIDAFDMMDIYVHEYVQSTVLTKYPEFKEFVEIREKSGGQSSSMLWYITPLDESNTFRARYNKICEAPMRQVYEHHGEDNDTTRYYLHKYYRPNTPYEMPHVLFCDRDGWWSFLISLDNAYKRKTLEITEEDILNYLIWKYVGFSEPDMFERSSHFLTSKDASSVTTSDVFEFAFRFSDINGIRKYNNVRMCHKAIIERKRDLNNRNSYTISQLLDCYKDTKKFKKLRATMTF